MAEKRWRRRDVYRMLVEGSGGPHSLWKLAPRTTTLLLLDNILPVVTVKNKTKQASGMDLDEGGEE